MICKNCNEEFIGNEKRKFCSNSCSSSYNNNIRYTKVDVDKNYIKKCRLCQLEKLIQEFYKRKGSVDGYRNDCKDCMKKIPTNKKENAKKYYQNNKEKVIEDSKKYYRNNKNKISLYKKRYQEENKENRNEKLRERYKTDELYKISVNIRSSLVKIFKRKGYTKKSNSIKLIGCSFEELKIHIESKFKDGMSWSNHGEWHIDHKIPLSWAESEEELIELCKFSNLQPLWEFENLSKKNYYSN